MASRQNFIFVLSVLSIGILLDRAVADKVAKKIYKDITAIKACVILTNATHQIGCRSSLGGHVGIVHVVKSDADIHWLLSDKATHAPYIPVFTADSFKKNYLQKLMAKKRINGALVIHTGPYGKAPKEGFSPAYECPMYQFGLYNNDKVFHDFKFTKWNKGGNAMSFMYFDFPIFALTKNDEVNAVISCYEKHNMPVNDTAPDYPLCAAQIKDFMFAAKDTPTCMRKTNTPGPNQNNFCDPLGDHNVWSTLMPLHRPLQTASDPRQVIVLASRIDTTSFFHELAPGVDNDASGLITLVAVAEALGKLKRKGLIGDKMNPIMFMLFNGEAWDYIGSSRIVYDMDRDQFPENDSSWKIDGGLFKMKTENIKYFLELNQVGLAKDDILYPHTDVHVVPKNQVIIKALQEAGKPNNVTFEDPSNKVLAPLPPASFQQFLKSNKSIPGVVITDHQKQYTNKYYNSRFDDFYQADAQFTFENSSINIDTLYAARLTRIATSIANALYKLANDGSSPPAPIEASKLTVANLAYCMFHTADCPLYKKVYPNNTRLPTVPLPRYVGVSNRNSPINAFTVTINRLLLYFTGYHRIVNSSNDCKDDNDKSTVVKVMKGNLNDSLLCVNGSVYMAEALSPAFLDTPDYSSTKYSTWAESTWNDELSVRIFLQASPVSQGLTLGAGLIITLLSFGLVCFIHRNAEKLFMQSEVFDTSLREPDFVN